MKRFLMSLVLMLFVVSLIVGCGEKAETPADNLPAGEPEEVADTTRLDSTVTEMADTVTATEGEGWGQ